MSYVWDITMTEEAEKYIKNNKEFKVLLVEEMINSVIFYRVENKYSDESEVYFDDVPKSLLTPYLHQKENNYIDAFIRFLNSEDWELGDSYQRTRHLDSAIKMIENMRDLSIKDYITKELKHHFMYCS